MQVKDQVEKAELVLNIMKYNVIGSIDNNITKIYEDFMDNHITLVDSMKESFNEICIKASEIQSEKGKGDIKYIFISYLRTNIKDNIFSYRVDMYDENWVMDEVECSGSIPMDFIFKYLREHDEQLKQYHQNHRRLIKEYDLEAIKMFVANYYNQIGFRIIKNYIEDMVQCQGYQGMKRDSGIKIFFGDYMDKSQEIYQEGQA